MILYFSGTGNSAYAARYIAGELQDELVNLNDRIKAGDNSPLASERPWIVAAPVYCWQLPRLVRDWMLQTEFNGNKDVYFVMTCGSNMGNGEKYLKQLCRQMGFNYKGAVPVVMPENYIAMFKVPDERESAVIIKKAERTLKRAISYIQDGQILPPVRTGVIGRLSSGLVNALYYPLIVKDRKFYSKDSCNGCGICAGKCPLNNIEMKEGRPQWNGRCTHCMACISYCPTEAIEYGNKSKGKRRYKL